MHASWPAPLAFGRRVILTPVIANLLAQLAPLFGRHALAALLSTLLATLLATLIGVGVLGGRRRPLHIALLHIARSAALPTATTGTMLRPHRAGIKRGKQQGENECGAFHDEGVTAAGLEELTNHTSKHPAKS